MGWWSFVDPQLDTVFASQYPAHGEALETPAPLLLTVGGSLSFAGIITIESFSSASVILRLRSEFDMTRLR